jgi:hypothetical protein
LLSDAKAEATVLEDYSAQELSVREGEEVEVEDARHGCADPGFPYRRRCCPPCRLRILLSRATVKQCV